MASASTTAGPATLDNGRSGFNLVPVGNGDGDNQATGTTNATLDKLAGGVPINGGGFSFEVGNKNDPASVVSSTNVAGGISDIVVVGNVRSNSPPDGTTTRSLTVQDGGLVGSGVGGGSNYPDIGTTNSVGDGTGTAVVTGGTSGFASVQVDVTKLGSTGAATGRWHCRAAARPAARCASARQPTRRRRRPRRCASLRERLLVLIGLRVRRADGV